MFCSYQILIVATNNVHAHRVGADVVLLNRLDTAPQWIQWSSTGHETNDRVHNEFQKFLVGHSGVFEII